MIKLKNFEARGRTTPLHRRLEGQFEPGVHTVGIAGRRAAARLINALYSYL
jgi:hypothetical protein